MTTDKISVTAYVDRKVYDRLLVFCQEKNFVRKKKKSSELVPNISKAIEFKLKDSFGFNSTKKEIEELKSRLDAIEQKQEGIVYFDGGSRGNPGLSVGCAYLVAGNQIFETGQILEIATNNEAEYRGLIVGLKKAKELGLKRLKVFGDSQLIINHVRGVWSCNQPHLQLLLEEVRILLHYFDSCDLQWVKRTENKKADEICNRMMDEYLNIDRQPSGTISDRIFKLIKGNPKFKQFAQLKAGRDQFSFKKLPALCELLTNKEVDKIKEEWLGRDDCLPDDKHLVVLYRWYLRGKPLITEKGLSIEVIANFACHKVRVDMEISNNILNKQEKNNGCDY